MDWKKKVGRGLNQGIDQSRVIFGKARKQVKNIGEATLLNAEISELHRKEEDLYITLGKEIYGLLINQGRTSVSVKTAEIKELFPKIEEVISDLAAKQMLEKKE